MRIKGADRDLVAEYVTAQAASDVRLSQTAVAAKIGVPRTSLDSALRRARADGDPRLAAMPERNRRHLENLHVADAHQLTEVDVHKARVTVACHVTDRAGLRDCLDALGLLPGGDAA